MSDGDDLKDVRDGEQEDQEERDNLFLDIDDPKNERLYFLGAGSYVQHDGKKKLPEPIQKWMAENGGELPPYMPLPSRAVEFHMDEEHSGVYTIPWSGKGTLPEPVLEYLKENGTLPRNTTIRK